MDLRRSTDFADVFDHGRATIIQSRLIRCRCEAAGTRSRRLAHEFLRAHHPHALPPMRGASEVVGVYGESPREVWRHRPTGNRWVVVTDRTGAPASAAGPFAAMEWDPLLRDYVPLDGHHGLEWLREHIHEFARGDADQP